jgi:dolichol-phosphate mannosyltransferase
VQLGHAAVPMKSQSAGIFVLLPVLNEVDNIRSLLDGIDGSLAGQQYTIGIVDDGSTDGTLEYLRQRMRGPDHHLHLISRKKTTRGSQRGGALHVLLLWGLQNTGHEVFVEMDGDLSHRPEELTEGIGLIQSGSCDVAIASKYVDGGSTVNRPFGRRQVSQLCSLALRLLLDWRIRDYSNGYRFYSRAAARLVSEHQIRYTSPIYLSEVLALWLRHGMRTTEFPTLYIGRNEGLSKLRIRDLVKAALGSFEIAARYHITGFVARKSAVSAVAPDALNAPKADRSS